MSARVGVWAVALAVLAAGCGVSTQESAEEIDRRDVPFGLLDEPPSDPPSTVTSAPATDSVVYLVGSDGGLVPVERAEAGFGPERALHVLLRGATDADVEAGLRSAVPPGTRIRRVRAANGVAVVSLGTRGFLDASSSEQALAVAQMVFTATQTPGVLAVRFRIGGEPAAVPAADGTLTDEPLTRVEVQPRLE